MTRKHIELGRRFAEYQTDGTPESQAQRSYMRAFMGQEDGMAWDELLRQRLVVVLGEPGSGKTVELRAQQARLPSCSFFLELNRLVGEEVASILDEDEVRRFAKWKNGNGEATFFLDAVDESKIARNEDFFTALDRVKKVIGSALGRSRFVISSRISEWRPQVDQDGVWQRFGGDHAISKRVESEKSRPATRHNSQQSSETKQEVDGAAPKITVVTLLSLSPSQVELYASASGIPYPQAFVSALEENNAWAFAGRPLDVEFLQSYWNEKGHLGNLTDLSEYMISKLLEEVPNRAKQDDLTPEQAREGAEYLAAAVILCRKLKFRIADAGEISGENMLSPAEVLPESWLPKARLALLDRALFDAASHGAMSFHHRYHSDYLAAAWIARLMNSNCGVEALEELLFAIVNGQRVMRPALKPVVAWLITEGKEPWRIRLAEWILKSCPEIHLAYGDPAVLPLEYRRRILSKLVEQYHGRKLVMLNWDRPALARFANTGLVAEINGYLSDKLIAEDLRADLLMLVREGRLYACVPTALEIFADTSSSDEIRSYVATVVRDIGDESHRKQLAELWQALPEISNTLLARLCEALFPQTVGANGLLALIARSGDVRSHSVDLPYYLNNLLKEKLDAVKAQELLDGILKLLLSPPLQTESGLSEHFYWVTSLIPVCLQRLLEQPRLSGETADLVISAIFMLEKVGRHGDLYGLSSGKESKPSIQQLVASHADLRRSLFWERIAKYRRKNNREPSRFELGGYGAEVELIPEDLEWLLADAGSVLPLADRRLALEIAANQLWSDGQRLLSSMWQLLSQTKGKTELVAICRQYLWHRVSAPYMRVWYRYFQHKLLEKYWWENRVRRLKEFRVKLYDWWWLWRHKGDLRKGLYPSTLSHFARLVEGDSGNQYGGSDWSKATKEWGTAISAAAKQGCIVSWGLFLPSFPHEKQQRNSVDHREIIGLAGLQTSWREGKLDFAGMSAHEVDLLVRYACNELNGFPEWFPALLAKRPADSAKTLEVAVMGEWSYPVEMEHVHDVVAKLAWMPSPSNVLTQVVMNRLLQGDPLNHRVLAYALSVIIRSCNDAPEGLLDMAKARVANYTQAQTQWFNWMSIWFQLDALSALDYLESAIAGLGGGADELVVRLCGVMYGRDDDQRQFNNPSYLKPNALARFIPMVHRYVTEAEDIQRANQGAYSPSARDHAQRFRGRLLEVLAASKESDADNALRGLLDVPTLSGSRDWILHLLDGRKYLLADDAAWEPMDVRLFAKEYRSEPRSDYQLFRLVVRLLADVKNQVESSENAANRLVVRSGDLEKDLQGYLHGELSERAMKWFSVTQESEIDLGQRPDIRVERAGLNPLPIEIKLANLAHWNVSKLLKGLETQLVGQYLRAANVRHGVYVLGNTEPKKRWEVSGVDMNFAELVAHIQERAKTIQIEMRDGVDGIEVIGIDFSDPRER